MFDWEGRILDNKSIMVVKAALPFLDIPVGEIIDLEGLLRAVRGFCHNREKRMIDLILNLFMMKRVFSFMAIMNEMGAAQMNACENGNSDEGGHAGFGGMEGMLDMLKAQMPKEQQEMFDMMSAMMTMMDGMGASQENEPESEEKPEYEPQPEVDEETAPEIPEIWKRIARDSGEESFYDGSE